MPLAALEFVVSGRVEVDEPSGRQVRGPRDVIGDLVDLLDEAPAPHAVASEPTLTLEFDRAALEDLLEDDFSIFLGVLRATARRLARRTCRSSSARSQKPERGFRKGRRSELDLVERVLLLQKEVHFRRCEIAPPATLAEGATEFVLGPGELLFPAGAAADCFVLLVTGRAVVRTPSTSFRVSAGEELGMYEALAGETHWSSATAGTTLRGLRIAASSLIDVVEDYPSFGLGLLRALAHEIEEGAS
jgi:CRP-like cAMP-binding protein